MIKRGLRFIRDWLVPRKPVFVGIDYTAIILDEQPFLLVAWRFRHACLLVVSKSKYKSYHRAGSAYIRMPGGIQNINISIRNLWRKKLLELHLEFTNVGSQQVKLSPRLNLELSGYYNSGFYNGSRKVDGFGALNTAVRLNLKNNGGSLQLAVTDLLRTGTVSSYFGALTREAFDLDTHILFHPESARSTIFKLIYSRSFGNSGSKPKIKEPLPENNRIRN